MLESRDQITKLSHNATFHALYLITNLVPLLNTFSTDIK